MIELLSSIGLGDLDIGFKVALAAVAVAVVSAVNLGVAWLQRQVGHYGKRFLVWAGAPVVSPLVRPLAVWWRKPTRTATLEKKMDTLLAMWAPTVSTTVSAAAGDLVSSVSKQSPPDPTGLSRMPKTNPVGQTVVQADGVTHALLG